MMKYREWAATKFNDARNWGTPIDPSELNLLHCAIGAVGEATEVGQVIAQGYGLDERKDELVAELGDVLFYLVTACNLLGIDRERLDSVKSPGNRLSFCDLMIDTGRAAEWVKKRVIYRSHVPDAVVQSAFIRAYESLIACIDRADSSLGVVEGVNRDKLDRRWPGGHPYASSIYKGVTLWT